MLMLIICYMNKENCEHYDLLKVQMSYLLAIVSITYLLIAHTHTQCINIPFWAISTALYAGKVWDIFSQYSYFSTFADEMHSKVKESKRYSRLPSEIDDDNGIFFHIFKIQSYCSNNMCSIKGNIFFSFHLLPSRSQFDFSVRRVPFILFSIPIQIKYYFD